MLAAMRSIALDYLIQEQRGEGELPSDPEAWYFELRNKNSGY